MLIAAGLGVSGLAASAAHAEAAPPAAPPSPDVVISQVSTEGPGGIMDEYVELRNNGIVPVNIGGWTLSACTAQNQVVRLATIAPETILQPGAIPGSSGQFYLLANAGYTRATPPDQLYVGDIQRLGGVMLQRPSLVPGLPQQKVDSLGFSRNVSCTESAPARPQLPFSDQSNLRVDPFDTNNNANDFAIVGPPTFPRNSGSSMAQH